MSVITFALIEAGMDVLTAKLVVMMPAGAYALVMGM